MNVYVCRLKEKTTNFSDEINKSIREFYKEKGHYSFKTAWLLAAICSLRYSKATLHQLLKKRFGSFIANYIVKMILDSINEYNNHHQRDMIACSPLVAMMYKNANYELSVNVFESFLGKNLPEPNFNLNGLEEKLRELNLANSENSNDWTPIKETVVTPRQLLESPDAELIGYLPHQKSFKN